MTQFLDIYFRVGREFEMAVKEATKENLELQRFCLTHERRSLVVNKLCAELEALEKSRRFNRETVLANSNKIVAGVVAMFVATAKAHKDQQNKSELARNFLSNEARAKEEMASIFREATQQ